MIKEERSALFARFAKSLIALGKYVANTKYEYPTPEFHYEIENICLDLQIKFFCIESFRDSAKSTLVCFWFVLHHLFFNPQIKQKYVLIQSKSRKESIKRLRTIKNIFEKSRKFNELFGDWGKNTALVWQSDYVVLKDGSVIDAKGTGQQMKGLKEDDQRPTLAILDDPQDEKNTITPERMSDAVDEMLALIASLDSKWGRLCIIGTPLDLRDLVSIAERMTDLFVFRRYAVANDETKEALWPEKYSYERHCKMRSSWDKIGRISKYNSEYMCRVMGKEEQIFKPQDMRYFDGDIEVNAMGQHFLNLKWTGNREQGPLIMKIEDKKISVNLFYGGDMAYSLENTANYTVLMPIAMDAMENIYVLPYIRGHYEADQKISLIMSEHKRLRPKLWTIENNATQSTLTDILRKLEKMYIPGLAYKNIPPGKDKGYITILKPYHIAHKIFIAESARDPLETEMIYFPKSQNDDCADALYWAVKRAYPPDHIEEKPGKKLYEWLDEKNTDEGSWMSA